jgi:RimJ/RimL family protein N-acetyltransferase
MEKKTQRVYNCLSQQEFVQGIYKLVPLRDEDKYVLMQWRNEQIDILRQKQPLTKEEQERYFATTIAGLFTQEKPGQLLFSFLENDILIGYGGLVHIDWESKNGEVSFITETKRNKDKQQFINDWCNYLRILKSLAKEHLRFDKIYTYAYDIRPWLYPALLKSGFIKEARLKNHVVINKQTHDVLIHACFFNQLVFRMANEDDVMKYFDWANDEEVRKNSFSNEVITIENHKKWFSQKLNTDTCFFYLFLLNGEPAGQIRIDKSNGETIIGISVDKNYRGKSLGTEMLKQATTNYLTKHKKEQVVAYIKLENKASLNSFKKAGFENEEIVTEQNHKSYKLYKKLAV